MTIMKYYKAASLFMIISVYWNFGTVFFCILLKIMTKFLLKVFSSS